MDRFLSESKRNLEKLDAFTKVHVVMGNEACDLDSAVSAIVTAYLLHELQPVATLLVVPVLNIARRDVKLRTEITYFFEHVDIPLDTLVCRDEIDLKKLYSQSKLSLTLVDHNLLPKEDADLQPAVQEIIDHHRLETSHRCDKTVEMVGSCCTLVADKVLHSKPELLDPQVALLLYGTILLDTVCLSESARKTTAKDLEVVSKLQALLPDLSKEEVFKPLCRAKSNVEGLTLDELLRKDLKAVCSSTKRIAISSVPGELKNICQENTMEAELGKFCKTHGYSALIILAIAVEEKCNSVQRQLAVFSSDIVLKQQLTSTLLAVGDPPLDLQVSHMSTDHLITFAQGNTQASRKVILPVVRKFLNTLDDNILPKMNEHCPQTNGTLSVNNQPCAPTTASSPEDTALRDPPFSPSDSSNSMSETAKDGGTEKVNDESFAAAVDADVPSQAAFLYRAQTVDFPDSPHLRSAQRKTGSTCGEDETDDEVLSRGEHMSISEARRERPSSLSGANRSRRKIKVNPDILRAQIGLDDDQKSLSSMSNKSDGDVFSPADDLATPDIETPDELGDSVLGRDDSTLSDSIPEMSAREEYAEERSWKTCNVGGVDRKIDMRVIEPYKKVLSHGGYFGEDRQAIIVFSACHLPDRCRRDYDYVMDNLFLYVLSTLDQLVADNYVLIYLHGATERSKMPSFGWLKRCYQMIDRRLRKNLKGLYLVHPTFWLKTIVIMTRPFISSKFSRKLRFVYSLEELSWVVPLDHVCIPDKVKQFDAERILEG
uniref:Exopolyphosphatase n=1 Tax=Rhipicephalus zambeziensis TaxID=60191 RepID=A0A224YYL0_9ACAR